jgi:hypothetical protein
MKFTEKYDTILNEASKVKIKIQDEDSVLKLIKDSDVEYAILSVFEKHKGAQILLDGENLEEFKNAVASL